MLKKKFFSKLKNPFSSLAEEKRLLFFFVVSAVAAIESRLCHLF
ncbi:hypothetical protein CHCC14821_0863 [Bacillus paralicheniformis]|nr:hypothetical protein CHCC14821_0863 [Bacillus paralicheniformis]